MSRVRRVVRGAVPAARWRAQQLAPLRLGPEDAEAAAEVQVHLDELVHFRGRVYLSGWAFHPTRRIRSMACTFPGRAPVRVRYGGRSDDVRAVHGRPAAHCRFWAELREVEAARARDLALHVRFADGAHATLTDLPGRRLAEDANNRLSARFFASLQALASGAVLEVGSRARSGNTVSGILGEGVRYVGFDVLAGPNVDVVGDAHQLSAHLEHGAFDAAFSISTFEHLAMPWKVAVELNRVLKPGGLVMVASHQTWPVHDAPWDFWRFSTWSWPALFNARTGFEIVEVAMGEPASVVATVLHAASSDLDREPAYLATSVLARKIGEASVSWDVDPAEVLDSAYPA